MSSGIGVLVGAGLRGRRRAGLIATFVVLVLAAVAIAAGLVVSRQGAPLLDAAAEDANVAHLVLYGDGDAISAVAEDPEVVEWSGPFDAVSGVELPLSGEIVPIEVTALDSSDIAVNHPPMRSGRWASASDEIVLDHSVSVDLAIDVGDTVTLRLAERDLTFSVVGTAVNFTDCFYPQCDPGRTWVTRSGLARFAAGDRVYAVGYLRFDDPAAADSFVERQAAAGVEGIRGTDSWLDTRGDFLTLDRVFGAFIAAFVVFKHRSNIARIKAGTESKVLQSRRQPAAAAAGPATSESPRPRCTPRMTLCRVTSPGRMQRSRCLAAESPGTSTSPRSWWRPPGQGPMPSIRAMAFCPRTRRSPRPAPTPG